MARGWESKGVEAQQQAMDVPVSRGAAPPADTAEREALKLARARALGDLQRACAPAHRAMLERAIADLEVRLKAFDTRTP